MFIPEGKVAEVKNRKDAVAVFMARIKQAYIDNQKALGIIASGRSAASLKTKEEPTFGQLLGDMAILVQKTGRKPGKFPPIQAIIEWLKDKKTFRVDDETGPGLKGLAFAIAKKIATKGTDIYLKKRPPLSIEEKLLEARKELALNLIGIEKEQVKEKFNRLRNAGRQ